MHTKEVNCQVSNRQWGVMPFCRSHAVRARRRFQRAGVLTCVGLLLLAAASAPGWAPEIQRALGGVTRLDQRARPLSEAVALASELDGNYTQDAVMQVAANRTSAARVLAIEALGEGGAGRALALLESLVRDETETPEVRRTSLESLYLIAAGQSVPVARDYVNDPVLGPTAQAILDGGGAILEGPSRIKGLLRMLR